MSADNSRPAEDPPSALPRGTRLGEFELLKVLGVGGFGIVYLAFDHALEREVAVKEYMPASLAGRTETMHVSLRSQSDSDTFALGLRSFVNEARMLARFDHPSLLKVHRFWEANGTAYMAMPVISGRTIKEVRAGMAEPPDETWLRELLLPLLGAIERLHGEGVYHRDIAPDNIVIEPDGRPVLLDFGAARRVISDKSQALTAILKPAYAPIEQYAEAGSVKQGPWTDIYALGATLHYMLVGRPPSPATARAIHDDQAPLSGQTLAGCSDNFLHIVDWMLAPRPSDRPQSVAALRDVLEGRVPPPVRRAAPAAHPGDWERTQVLPGGTLERTQAAAADDPATMIVPRKAPVAAPPPPAAPPPTLPPLEAAHPPMPSATPAASPVAPAAETAAARSGSKRMPVLIGAGVVLVAAAYFLWPRPAPVPGPDATPPPLAAAASEPIAAPASAAPPAAASAVARVEAPDNAASVPAHKVVPVIIESKPASKPVARGKPPAPAPVVRAPEPEPSAPAPEPAKPASAPKLAPPVLPASAPAPVKIASPSERCGKRVLLALWLCIEQQCAKPELAQHPECVKWRTDEEKKANPMLH